MLAEDVRLGTSTPKADPSGDYAFELFDKSGHADSFKAKALQLTGGPDSAKPPEGRNTYAWVLDSDQADVFLTYCTNAVLAQKEMPQLQIVQVPETLSVGADYGLIVLEGAPADAWKLAMHILSPAGQSILADYGFDAAALPKEN
jgi:ABC-type molybdate transport system substrate-binding protein